MCLFLPRPCRNRTSGLDDSLKPVGAGTRGPGPHNFFFENNAGGGRITVDLAIFSKFCTLRVLQNEGGADSLGEMMGREKCLAGVNGGYFNEEFAPIGLRMANGQMS